MGLHANRTGHDLPDHFWKNWGNEMSEIIPSTAQTALEQSFLQGTNAFLEALADKDGKTRRKWAINTLGTLGSVLYPNTSANISKAADNTARVTSDESFGTELLNNFKTKMFAGGNLPTKVNLWGEPVKGAPVGHGKYSWYLFDVTKMKNVPTNTFNYKIYDTWKNAPADLKDGVLPNIPTQTISVKNQKYKLTNHQYQQYQEAVGKMRASLTKDYVESPNWTKDDIEERVDKLKKLYESGLRTAKKRFLQEHPEIMK